MEEQSGDISSTYRDLHSVHYYLEDAIGRSSRATVTPCGLNRGANVDMTTSSDRVTCRSCIIRLEEQRKREREAKVRAGLAATTPDEDGARAEGIDDLSVRDIAMLHALTGLLANRDVVTEKTPYVVELARRYADEFMRVRAKERV